MKKVWISLGVVCVLVIGVYANMSQSGVLELVSPNVSETYYNLLVQGFRAGQLNLKKDVPTEFAKLTDPYDPAASISYWAQPHRMLDLSYYKGKLFLYFGVTPALILFWPYAALTGHYLFHRQAVAIFSMIGFLASTGLLFAAWRRYFAEVSVAVVVACTLALGFVTGVPILLSWSDVYEVPIICGYMLTMLALAAIWCALHQPERRGRWLVAASGLYGLAVGSRPSLLFGAVILLVPLLQSWRERRKIGAQLMAAIVPITLIGLGLMLYNDLRFGSPFEFGQRYQIAGERQFTRQFFNLRYLWFNLRVYFLEPARWSLRSPFVYGITVPPLPANYGQVRNPFGVLTSVPVVWLALAAPLAWRNRPGPADSLLRSFVTTVALLFGMGALTIGLFCGASLRYEVDFLPALVLLAVIGILGTERALVDRPQIWRNAARCGWGLLLIFSVAFNLFATVQYHAEAHDNAGINLFRAGKLPEARAEFEQALRINPHYVDAQENLAVTLEQEGKIAEAAAQYEKVLRINPDYFEAHNGLAGALIQLGRRQEAREHLEKALRLKSNNAEAHNNLGNILIQEGRYQDAIAQFEQALRLKPEFAEAHNNLGSALADAGRPQEAIHQWEEALRLKPDDAAAHFNLASVLEQAGRTNEAIEHYEQVLRIKPDSSAARNALARLQARQ